MTWGGEVGWERWNLMDPMVAQLLICLKYSEDVQGYFKLLFGWNSHL